MGTMLLIYFILSSSKQSPDEYGGDWKQWLKVSLIRETMERKEKRQNLGVKKKKKKKNVQVTKANLI